LPQEKLESTLAAWFKQACEINASIDDTHLKEKALNITFPLGIANVLASLGGTTDLRGDATLFTELFSGESRSVDPESVEDWKNYRLLQEIEGYALCNIYIYIYIFFFYSTT
jgi:hypothetical protein